MIQKIKNIFSSDSTKSKIARNVFWSVVGKVVSMSSSLFVGILVARYLGPSQYGAMNYAVSIVALFSVLASFGMDNIVVRELSRNPDNRDAILGTAFTLRICLAFLTIALIGLYLLSGAENKSASVLILIYSGTLIFSSFDVIRSYFTSIIKNEYVVKSEIVRTLIAAVLQIILLLIKAPLSAFITVLVFNSALLASGYTSAYIRKVGSIRKWTFDKFLAFYILRTSFPLLLSLSAAVVYQRIDKIMIGRMLDNTSLGYFATAMSFAAVIAFIPTMAIQTVSPILVKYYKENKLLYEERSQMIMNIITWSMILVCCLISLFSYYIIYYTYGEEYIIAVPVLQILAFKTVGVAMSMTGGNLIVIENIHKYAAVRNIIACGVCVLCNYLLIPRWGIVGSAWATIITVIFQGWAANIFIPAYHHIFKKQTIAIFCGWRDMLNFKQLLK